MFEKAYWASGSIVRGFVDANANYGGNNRFNTSPGPTQLTHPVQTRIYILDSKIQFLHASKA